jgi:ankyrin repeat protein
MGTSSILDRAQRGRSFCTTMCWRQATLVFLTAAFLGSTTYAQAPGEVPKNSAIRFARDVAPILRDKCITCHGRTMQQAGLRLDSRFEMLRGGKSGPAITENSDADSLLIRRISGSEAGMRMPPPGPLSDREIEIFRAWVRGGAPWDAEATFDQAHTVLPGARELFEALRHGQLAAVGSILDREPNLIRAVDENGSTPLILAAYWAGPREVKELLARGADPNAKNDSGVPALFPATDNLETTRLLVLAGADVNARTEAGDTALMVAARRAGAVPVAAYLLEKGAEASAATQGGASALHRAAASGDVEMLKLLLDRGAKVNVQRKDGRTPLGSAATWGHAGAVCYLLSKGANPNLGDSGLSRAVFQGNVEIVKALLEAGAEVKGSGGPEPILVLACFSYDADPQIVKMLLERSADPAAKSQQGKTPLELARERGHEEIARMLVQAIAQKQGAEKGNP